MIRDVPERRHSSNPKDSSQTSLGAAVLPGTLPDKLHLRGFLTSIEMKDIYMEDIEMKDIKW
jgi:hypothetical protein